MLRKKKAGKAKNKPDVEDDGRNNLAIDRPIAAYSFHPAVVHRSSPHLSFCPANRFDYMAIWVEHVGCIVALTVLRT